MSNAVEKYIKLSSHIKTRCELATLSPGGRVDRNIKLMAIFRLLEKKLSRRYAKSTARRYAKAMTIEIRQILNTDLFNE